MSIFRPRLMQATTASERMDALCDFIQFWLGPRKDAYGESIEAVGKRSLPMPLKRLFEFAGRWPNWDGTRPLEFAVPALSHQDTLVALEQLKEEDGNVVFVYENQGVWNCRTLSDGDDPPVWCSGDLMDEDGNWITGEKRICESLSRFLVSFVLQELTLGSRFYLCDESLSALFESQRQVAVPLWIHGPYVHGNRQEYFLWGNVLAGKLLGDSFYFAANRDDGIEFMTTNQGPITEIDVMMFRPWSLDIRSDGSARIRFLRGQTDEAAEVRAGTFPFYELVDQLAAAASNEGHWERNGMVAFHRKGQSTAIRAKHLHDGQFVTSLFWRALENAVNRNKALERRFEAEWPL